MLDARGLQVDAAARKQILACTEFSQLKLWLRKAATAQFVQEIFARAPKPTARNRRSTKASKPRSKR